MRDEDKMKRFSLELGVDGRCQHCTAEPRIQTTHDQGTISQKNVIKSSSGLMHGKDNGCQGDW